MRPRSCLPWWALALVAATLGLGADAAAAAGSGLFGKVKPTYTRVLQCREGCLEKFAIKESICQQRPECSMSGFPPYKYKSLPDALHLLCWDECAKPPPPKINKSILETWALRTVSMLQQGALVLVDVAWAPLNMPNQCLVTWEVSGGGLMGNLLTESSNVQLSLWPDTKYRVQVTCKNKKTGAISRSLPLTIDTMEANPAPPKEMDISATTPTAAPPTTADDALTTLSEDELKYKEFHEFYNRLAAKWNPSNSISGSGGDVTVSKVVPASQSDYSALPIATLSELEQPLLACAIGGVVVLVVVLSFYVWLWSAQSTPSDKKLLFEEDNSSIVCTSIGETNHFGGGVTQSDPATLDPNNYPRTVHVLTV